jgi:hypothetical protein
MKCRVWGALAAGAMLLFPFALLRGQTGKEITREKILATGQEWQERHSGYEPPADMIEALKTKFGAGMKIDVYLGLWCPDSRHNVPLFIKVLDLTGSGVPVRYVDLPRKADKDIKYFVEDLKVERVPTFILYRDGEEIGRIIEKPTTGMIEDIMEIVFRE